MSKATGFNVQSAGSDTAANTDPNAPAARITGADSNGPRAAGQPDDRSTSFVAVEGGAESRSGELLLVEAYSVLWFILLVWVGLLWKKQSQLHRRLDDLDKVLDKAAGG
jgi:hypothetical protein